MVFLPHVHAHAAGQRVPRFLPLSDHAGRALFSGEGVSRNSFPFAAAGFHQRLRRQSGARRDGRAGFGTPRPLAEQAWTAAVRAQTEAEDALRQLGQKELARAVAEGKPAILLAGHSYNAFTPEASQSVGKKLSSMGITVIPADCLPPVEKGPTAWHFANKSSMPWRSSASIRTCFCSA